MKIKRLFFAIAVYLVLTISTGVYGMIETLSLDDLVVGSEIIVIGTLEKSIDSKTVSSGFKVFRSTIKITETLKKASDNSLQASEKASSSIDVLIMPDFEDEIKFPEEGSFIAFLNKNDEGKWTATNGIQSCWPIDNDRFLGMGNAFTLKQVKECIKKNHGKKPSPKSNVPPEPEF
ncbi:MAG: hypothetical protein HQM10_09985 [Candidatus Riflebacteria bacterium]|nr:hypothetical protein [Candidatus Riflebacteria bacterium]